MIIDRLMLERGYAASACLVVAHPDDESLWFGGLLATVPFEWTVIACSVPDADPIRAWKFYAACERLNAKGMVIPLQEAPASQPPRPGVFGILKEALPAFDMIVTHSRFGEYGHKHHVEIGGFLRREFPTTTVSGCYGDEEEGEFIVDLSTADMERKLAAIASYDHTSHTDAGLEKSKALLRKYGPKFDLARETYSGPE